MGLDLEQIRNNYSKFDDFEIERIAKTEAGGIEPEVLEILIDEIKKRGLNNNLLKGIDAQTTEISEEELTKLLNKITILSCPECGRKETPLVGTLVRKVRSYLVFTSYERKPLITCETCAATKRKNSIISNFLLGWWGIPLGIINTPRAIISTLIDKNKKDEISDAILTNFVLNNIGEIQTNWDNESELVSFIHHVNRNDI